MADFDVQVIIDPTRAKQGGKRVRSELNSIETSADRMRKTITRAFSFFAAGAGISSAVRTIANFSQEMSTVRAITRATGSEFQSLRNLAKDLGATTRYSATEAAQGMTFLARAGFNTSQVMASIGDTLKLAQAGALDLGSAADIASNVLTGFRLKAEEASRVVDVLAFASNNANTNVGQLGEAMKFVAPVAAGVGVSLEEATAAASALSDAGLQASLAGTGLRRILSELESPAAKTQEILKSLGLSADDVRVSQVGLTAAMTKLRDAGVDTGLALEIFGDRGGPAFEVLSNALPKVANMTEQLGKAAGTADRMAAVMDDNLNGALLAVKSAIEALIISFGDLGAESVLTSTFRELASMIRFAADHVKELTGIILTGAAAWQVYRIAVGGVSGGMFGLFGIMKKVAAGLVTLAATNPFTAIAAAIVIVIGLLATFSDQISLSSDGIVTLRDYAVAAFQLISESAGPMIDAIQNGIAAAINWARQALADFGLTWGDVFEAAKTTINAIIGYEVGLFRAGAVIFKRIRQTIIDALGADTARLIMDVFKFTIQFLIDSFKKFAGVVLKVLDAVGLATVELGNAIGVSIKLPEFKVPAEIKDFGAEVKDAFISGFEQDYVGDMINAVTPAFEALQKRAREVAVARTAPAQQAAPTAGVPTAAPAVPERTGPTAAQTEALKAQKDLYDQIKAPIEEYKTTLAAANALLDAGKISAQEYAAALQQTQFGGELQQLQLDLMPEGEAELAALENTLQQRLDLIRQFQEAKLVTEQEAMALSLEANRKHNQEIMALETERFKTQLRAGRTAFSALASAAKNYAGEQSQIYRAMFAVSKGFAIAETTVAIAQGIANSAKLGWPANVVAIASTIAQTAGLISQIQGAQMQGFQNGGDFRVGGAGGTDSQLVAFRASPNETVSVRTPGQERAAQQVTQPQPAAQPIQIVNVDDPGKLEDFMATPAGTKSVLNIIKKNPTAIKSIVG